MNTAKFGLCCGLTSLVGCGTVPGLPIEYSVSVADIVANIRCELKGSAERLQFLRDDAGWTAGIDLSLQAINSGDGGFDPSLATPLKPGLMVATAGMKYIGTADRTVSLKFSQNLEDPDEIPCQRLPSGRNHLDRLGGNLGIADWLTNLQKTITSTDAHATTSGYTLEFTVEKSGTVGPAFSLVPVGMSIVSVGFNLSGSRKDVHTLLVTFTKNEKPAPKGARERGRSSVVDEERNRIELNNLILQRSLQQ